MKQAPRPLADQHERAGHAKQVPGAQQYQHQRAAKMNPTHGGGQVLGRQVGPKSPWAIMAKPTISNGICRNVRVCRQPRKRADDGELEQIEYRRFGGEDELGAVGNCLIRADTPNVPLAFQFPAARQGDVQKDDPIASHGK